MVANNLNTIYKILKEKGIDKSFTQEYLLPDWWEESILNTKAGYLQTLSIIAKRLGVALSLFLEPKDFELSKQLSIKFKTAKKKGIYPSNFWIQTLSYKLSEIIKTTYDKDISLSKTSYQQTRSAIIGNSKILNLSSLLEYLWTNGIPVLYVSNFPKDFGNMDGMVIKSDTRPIIVISNKRKHDSWILFILAHELGHIQMGHLSDSGNIIYDADISENKDSKDKEEIEANEFAINLLFTKSYSHNYSKPASSFALVNTARKIGQDLNIDPGAIVLNYGYLTNNYGLAYKALKIIDSEEKAIVKIQDMMKKFLNFDNLSEENYDYFTKLTSLSDLEA